MSKPHSVLTLLVHGRWLRFLPQAVHTGGEGGGEGEVRVRESARQAVLYPCCLCEQSSILVLAKSPCVQHQPRIEELEAQFPRSSNANSSRISQPQHCSETQAARRSFFETPSPHLGAVVLDAHRREAALDAPIRDVGRERLVQAAVTVDSRAAERRHGAAVRQHPACGETSSLNNTGKFLSNVVWRPHTMLISRSFRNGDNRVLVGLLCESSCVPGTIGTIRSDSSLTSGQSRESPTPDTPRKCLKTSERLSCLSGSQNAFFSPFTSHSEKLRCAPFVI